MCPSMIPLIEFRIMLPDHLIYQFNGQVPRKHEGFRGTLWKYQSLVSNDQTIARASYGQNVLGSLRICFDELA